jgi:tRNA(adenine34) deaminase
MKPARIHSMSRIDEHDRRYMLKAFTLAKKAASEGDSPVGAVIVQNGRVIGSGYNRIEAEKDPTAHAEIIALRRAVKALHDWRLPEATLYATLEPCIMCAAALVHARVRRIVFGARDERWGGFGSLFDFAHDPRINHEIEVVSGVMEKEAADLLRSFFRQIRGNSWPS